MEKFDVVSKPAHYAEGRKYEPKDVIRDWGLNFNLGSAVKYISRAGRKDDILQDLNKAKQFIEFEIEALSEEKKPTQKYEGNFDNIVFTSEEDATEVLGYLKVTAYRYGTVSVADFLDACGLTSEYESQSDGWYFQELHLNAKVVGANDGYDDYILHLPKPHPISEDRECIYCIHYKRCLDHDNDPNCYGFERRQ